MHTKGLPDDGNIYVDVISSTEISICNQTVRLPLCIIIKMPGRAVYASAPRMHVKNYIHAETNKKGPPEKTSDPFTSTSEI